MAHSRITECAGGVSVSPSQEDHVMTTTLESKGFPTEFTHAAIGGYTLVPTRIAVRWKLGTTDDDRNALIRRLRLRPAEVEGERPLPQVNRSDGLWWVRRANDGPADGDLIDRLE